MSNLDNLDPDRINTDDESGVKPTIPADDYHLRVVDCEARKTKETDKELGVKTSYLNFRVIVQSGEYKGESFFAMASLHPKYRWGFIGDAQRLGVSVDGTPDEVAAAFNGVEGIGRVRRKPRKVDGQLDPNQMENSIGKWLGPA